MKEKTINILTICVFYSLLLIGVILINWRFEQIEQQKSADEQQISTNEYC